MSVLLPPVCWGALLPNLAGILTYQVICPPYDLVGLTCFAQHTPAVSGMVLDLSHPRSPISWQQQASLWVVLLVHCWVLHSWSGSSLIRLSWFGKPSPVTATSVCQSTFFFRWTVNDLNFSIVYPILDKEELCLHVISSPLKNVPFLIKSCVLMLPWYNPTHSGLYPWLCMKYNDQNISDMYMLAVTNSVSVKLLVFNFTFLK